MYINIKEAGILGKIKNTITGKNIDQARERLATFRKNNATRLAKDPSKLNREFAEHMYRGERIAHSKINQEKAKTALGISGLASGIYYTGYQAAKPKINEKWARITDQNDNIPIDTRKPASSQPADGPDYYDWQEYVAQEGTQNTPDRDNHPTLSPEKVANELRLDASTRAHLKKFSSEGLETLQSIPTAAGNKFLGASIATDTTPPRSYFKKL